jgi:hypothetical protein
MLACAASAAGSVSRPAPRRGAAAAALAVVALAACTGTALRLGLAQAERRESGRLAFYGDAAGLVDLERRWAAPLAERRPPDPGNLFVRARDADRRLAEARRRHDPALALEAAALFAAAQGGAPAVLSLLDDRADALEVAGRRAEAARLRQERVRRDPAGVFAPAAPVTPEGGSPAPRPRRSGAPPR